MPHPVQIAVLFCSKGLIVVEAKLWQLGMGLRAGHLIVMHHLPLLRRRPRQRSVSGNRTVQSAGCGCGTGLQRSLLRAQAPATPHFCLPWEAYLLWRKNAPTQRKADA